MKFYQQRKIIFVFLSITGLTYGAYLLRDIVNFTFTAEETHGQIIARDNSTFTVEYKVSEQTYRIKQDLPSTKSVSGIERAKLQRGTQVLVLYDPSYPGNGRWKSSRNWIFPSAVIFVSLVAGFAGFFPNAASKPLNRNELQSR